MAASHRAFTLIELTIVVMILAILASALFANAPTAESQQKVDLAAETVAMTLRFARSEALRAGEERSAAIVAASGRVYAAKPDLTGGNVGVGLILDHPLDKRSYDFTLGQLKGTVGVELATATAAFQFRGLATAQDSVVFDAVGLPYFLQGGTRYPLSGALATLRHSAAERTIQMSPAGRVIVQ